MAGTSSISGLVSGLDTSSIISSLMAIESQPKTLLQNQVKDTQSQVTAYQTLQSKLTTLSTAAGKLQKASSWGQYSVTSTDSDVATASATSSATAGQVRFTVKQLAKTHGVVSSTTAAATSTVIASGSTVSLTIGSTTTSLSVGNGTLAEVASAINASGLGVSAAAVNTGSGYRLQMTAKSSGSAGEFSLSGLTGGTAITTQAQDAKITLGEGTAAYDVTSSSNKFADILPGVTINAVSESTTPVTLTIAADPSKLADSVKGLVDAANALLSEIKTDTSYDATNKKGSVLTGDSATRRVATAITSAITSAVSQSSLGSATFAGVSVDKSGTFSFDRDKFLDAYDENPTAVQKLFTQDATTTGSVGFVYTGNQTKAGTYSVVVNSVGSTSTGTINGVAATGSGNTLAVPATDTKTPGLTVSFVGSTTGTIGTVTYEPGIAQRIMDAVELATNSTTGYLEASETAATAKVKRLNDSIDAYTIRLTKREETLKRQFTALETALQQLQSQSNSLTSALSSLSSSNG